MNVVGAYQGSLEVCVAGRWNGVCDDDDGDSMNQTAAVACRQNGCGVGFAEAGSLCSEHRFKFQCSGHEANLTSCDIENSSNCSLNGNSTMCMNVHCMFCPAPVSLLPYGESVGDLRVPSILDTSSGPINLAQNFSFFGSEKSTIFVSEFLFFKLNIDNIIIGGHPWTFIVSVCIYRSFSTTSTN